MARSAAVRAKTDLSSESIGARTGVAEATFYRWTKVYGGMDVSEIRRLKQLDEENAKLKRLVADLSLDKMMLQDALKKVVKPVRRSKASPALPSGVRRIGAPGQRL